MEAFKSKINAVRDILRKDGVTGIDSITHCVAFYILRNLDIELCEKLNIPVKFAYCNFNKDDNETILDHGKLFEKFYLPSRPMDCFVGILANKFKFKAIKQFGIKTSRYLESIFNIFEGIDPKTLNCNCDIVGTIYEIHLATGTSGSGMRDLGQYFTHRKVIKFMIELCAPKVVNGHIETILDPSMGTGGFLTMATKYLNEHNPDINWTVEQSNIIGFDISDSVQSLAYINLLLENGELFENIVSQDTLHNDLIANNVHIDKVDNILANVPFGLKNIIHADCAKRIVDLKIRGTKAEPLFLQLIMLSLKENGRCAVIIPDGVLFNDAKLHTETRKYLIENMNLKKIVSLDDDEFFMNTGVKSSILYFVNDGTTQEVEFSKIKLASGQIAEESLKKVKKADLVAKGYTLFINKYFDNQVVKLAGVEYKKLGDVCNVINGFAFKSTDYSDSGNINIITIKNIDRAINTLNCEKIVSNDKYNKYKIEKNDILMSLTGNIKIGIYKSDVLSYLNQRVIKFTNFSTNIIQNYLYYYIEKILIIQIQNNTKGSIQGNISSSEILNLEIPIPPLAIQQQIVSILDNTYSIINTNKEQIARYEAQKQALIWSSTLNCAVQKLNTLVSFKAGKYNSSDKKEEGAYPFYNSEAQNPVGFSNDYCFDYESYIILIKDGGAGAGKYGDQIGLGKVFKVSGKSAATSHQIALFPNNINQTSYIYYYLQYIKNKIMDLANYTTGLGTIRKSVIEDLDIPIPPPEIQSSIVQQCEHIDSIITMLSKDNERLEGDNLIQRILESLNQQETRSTHADIIVYDAIPIEPTLDSILEHIEETTPVKKKIAKKTIGKKTIGKKTSK